MVKGAVLKQGMAAKDTFFQFRTPPIPIDTQPFNP
jgi:hypothetical protein